MGDDHLVRLRLHADFEARRQARLQFLGALEAMGQGAELAGSDYCFGGFESLSEPLWHVEWPPCFGTVTPARFNGSSVPVEFLQQYAVAIRAARGDGRVRANWFPMATKDEPRRWILGFRRDPSCPREISASASSTSTLPWGRSPRARRRSPLLVASSPGRAKMKLGAWGLCLPALS
jgi:hypothetical protein